MTLSICLNLNLKLAKQCLAVLPIVLSESLHQPAIYPVVTALANLPMLSVDLQSTLAYRNLNLRNATFKVPTTHILRYENFNTAM